ncbi:MAG: hypothetical protein FJ319_06740 [SAR202 cluster bacterium]|nr:hypothetical protein [SAR202 cluster bacterium]
MVDVNELGGALFDALAQPDPVVRQAAVDAWLKDAEGFFEPEVIKQIAEAMPQLVTVMDTPQGEQMSGMLRSGLMTLLRAGDAKFTIKVKSPGSGPEEGAAPQQGSQG